MKEVKILIQRNYDGTFRAYEIIDGGGNQIGSLQAPLLGKEKWVRVLVALKVVESSSEAERLIRGGGFEVNEVVLKDPASRLDLGSYGEYVVRAGKKKFVRIIVE